MGCGSSHRKLHDPSPYAPPTEICKFSKTFHSIPEMLF
ncbi:unnamed protein product [Brugia timori]|uniref:Uncharacterized protein n=1 Tax=Brugia timori TaxID=42155 RepID=A0A0R3R6Q9_9BILA|nr:unnamed protein product [Brugia timori]